MQEVIRTNNLVLLSALKAALTAEGIEHFEFDGEIAGTYVGLAEFPRRLMVLPEDYPRALAVAEVLCPEEIDQRT